MFNIAAAVAAAAPSQERAAAVCTSRHATTAVHLHSSLGTVNVLNNAGLVELHIFHHQSTHRAPPVIWCVEEGACSSCSYCTLPVMKYVQEGSCSSCGCWALLIMEYMQEGSCSSFSCWALLIMTYVQRASSSSCSSATCPTPCTLTASPPGGTQWTPAGHCHSQDMCKRAAASAAAIYWTPCYLSDSTYSDSTAPSWYSCWSLLFTRHVQEGSCTDLPICLSCSNL